MDNLPNAIAVQGMDAVIGVDVGSSSLSTARRIKDKGFAAIYMRAAQIMMKSLQVSQLSTWAGPPLLLVRPAVWHYNWFSFASTRRMIDAGYDAGARRARPLRRLAMAASGGVYPRRTIELSVVRERCIGCTLCVTLAPDLMAMDDEDKAVVLESPLEWSRADGDFIHQCPTDAIKVEVVDGNVRTLTMERKIEPE